MSNKPVRQKTHPFTNVKTNTNECDWCHKPDYAACHKVDGMTGGQALLTGLLLGSIMRMNHDADFMAIRDVRPLMDDEDNYLNVLLVEMISGQQFTVTIDPFDEDAD